jgi:mannose/fructose/N-acetylgalactosamine-specific phosphotransferase system component IIC
VTEHGAAVIALLLAWGTLTGMDLVTFPQALFSRPIVACTGAGLILGDGQTGLVMGVLLELFGLDVLPVGASRYPDYGPGAVAAVTMITGGSWEERLGLGTLFALTMAVLGGWSLVWLRQVNGRMIQHQAAGLAAGDASTVSGIQLRGLAGDLLRSLALTAVGLLFAWLLRPHLPVGPRYVLVTATAIGAGVAAATGGALRAAGRGARLRWLVIGTGIGLLAAVLT